MLSRFIQSHYARVVIFDTLEEYDDGIIVHSFKQFAAIARQCESSPRFRIIYRMDTSRDNERDFHFALHALYEWGSLQIVIEEVQELSGTHFMPPMLKRTILTGRHNQISLLCTTQRPGELHKTILSQAGHVFAGQLHDRNDVNYVSSFMGSDSQRLVNLPQRHFLYFRPGIPISQVTLEGKTLKIIDNSKNIPNAKAETPIQTLVKETPKCPPLNPPS